LTTVLLLFQSTFKSLYPATTQDTHQLLIE